MVCFLIYLGLLLCLSVEFYSFSVTILSFALELTLDIFALWLINFKLYSVCWLLEMQLILYFDFVTKYLMELPNSHIVCVDSLRVFCIDSHL